MHRDAEPGEAEPGVAASPGGGIYKPVRTDHHEPLGSGGAGENLDLLERLVGKVPVYHLACDISEDAVKTLEQELVRDSSEEEAAAALLQKACCKEWRKSMRLVDTRAYVGMLRELVEQGKKCGW